MDHAFGEGVNRLRKMMEIVIKGFSAFQGRLFQSENEPFQKVSGLPSQIIIIEYARPKQGAIVDIFRGVSVELDEDVEYAAIDISDAAIAAGELHIRVQARIPKVFE